jgi:uncharacterized protein YndB with AHSA1/START domain
MRVLKWIAAIVVALAVVFVGGAYLLPSSIGAERSVVIDAPPEKVYARLIDLKKFNDWSPWAKIDPEAHYSFEGMPEGPGQVMKWSSTHERVGSGSQEIMEATPDESVKVALDLGEVGMATSWYTLKPEGAGTRVTWGFATELGNSPVMRWKGLRVGGRIAADFDKGLASLKEVVEKEAAGG